jgi:hypothetical protein
MQNMPIANDDCVLILKKDQSVRMRFPKEENENEFASEQAMVIAIIGNILASPEDHEDFFSLLRSKSVDLFTRVETKEDE